MSVYTELDEMLRTNKWPCDYIENNMVMLLEGYTGGSYSLGHDFIVDLYLSKDGELISLERDPHPSKASQESFEWFCSRDSFKKEYPGLTKETAVEYYKRLKKG